MTVPHTGFGLLNFTWRGSIISDEDAFPVMKAAIENGATIWSSSSVYGPPGSPTAGLHLLARYFKQYPEHASKVALFIRGCFDGKTFKPTCTREEVRASWEEAHAILGGIKYIDVFGPARMDQDVPVEETVGALKELQDEGKIGAVGLSEVRAETIRRASAICPIKFTEAEFSIWETEMLSNGVAAAAKECNVDILAYAPLGYGFLTGSITKYEDLPQDRRALRKNQPENFQKNIELIQKIRTFAAKQDATPAQIAIAWIRSCSNTGLCGIIIPIPGSTSVERATQNCLAPRLSVEAKAELDAIINSFVVSGKRGAPGGDHFMLT